MCTLHTSHFILMQASASDNCKYSYGYSNVPYRYMQVVVACIPFDDISMKQYNIWHGHGAWTHEVGEFTYSSRKQMLDRNKFSLQYAE